MVDEVFHQLRQGLNEIREEEQPEFDEGQLTTRHLAEEAEYGEVVSDGLSEEEAQERTENSVQKQLLDRVEALIDRVQTEYMDNAEPFSTCCNAPVETETVRGRLTDRMPRQTCTECGADLDVHDVEYSDDSGDTR